MTAQAVIPLRNRLAAALQEAANLPEYNLSDRMASVHGGPGDASYLDAADMILNTGPMRTLRDDLALEGHIRHGETLTEAELLRDALTHVLAAARDVDRNMRSVVDEKCDDCYRGPGEGHDEDCGMGPLAAACDYAVQLLRGRVSFEIAPTTVGGTDG